MEMMEITSDERFRLSVVTSLAEHGEMLKNLEKVTTNLAANAEKVTLTLSATTREVASVLAANTERVATILADAAKKREDESTQLNQDLEDKYDKLNSKVNYFAGIGTGLGLIVGYFSRKLGFS